MTVDQILSVYDHALNQDDGCARYAFTCAIESLTGTRLSWQVAPIVLVNRAFSLTSEYINTYKHEIVRCCVLTLCERLQRDMIIYVYDQVDQLTCKWSDYAQDNAGDLECELALSKLWSGSWWAPVGRCSMISLNPLEIQ